MALHRTENKCALSAFASRVTAPAILPILTISFPRATTHCPYPWKPPPASDWHRNSSSLLSLECSSLILQFVKSFSYCQVLYNCFSFSPWSLPLSTSQNSPLHLCFYRSFLGLILSTYFFYLIWQWVSLNQNGSLLRVRSFNVSSRTFLSQWLTENPAHNYNSIRHILHAKLCNNEITLVCILPCSPYE